MIIVNVKSTKIIISVLKIGPNVKIVFEPTGSTGLSLCFLQNSER